MNWATAFGLLAIVIVPVLLIGYVIREIAERYFAANSPIRKALVVYPLAALIWVSALLVIGFVPGTSRPSPVPAAAAPPPPPPIPAAAPPVAAPELSAELIRPPYPRSQLVQFPWPPPDASGFVKISMDRLIPQYSGSVHEVLRLIDVDRSLTRAMRDAGHYEASYYAVPQGFAVVSRIENINNDGTPKSSVERWDVDRPTSYPFSLASYLEALFTAPTGRYRVIVFIVTSVPFAASGSKASRDEAMMWLVHGLNRLPDSIGLMPLESNTSCTAMIYEFQKGPPPELPRLKLPGYIPASVHIVGAGLGGLIR